jgi:ligand-binding sensor domain-containing protein/signal transduction histidine kinase
MWVAGLIWGLAWGTLADSTNSNWSVYVLQSGDGLPNNNITGLAQTRDGYLWVASSGHFARFDGVHFEEFTSKSVLPAYPGYTGRISTILEDSKGNLWLAMVHGPVVCLHNGVPRIFTNNLPDYTAQGMVEDGEGAIWITYHGSVVCRIQNGEVKRFGEEEGLPARFDCALAVDNRGCVWFAKEGQVGRFENGCFDVMARNLPLTLRVAASRKGGVWVASGRELFHCDDTGTLQSVGVFKSEGAGSDTTALMEDKSGAVWIGTAAHGLFRHSVSGFESIPTSHPYIANLLQDREGNVWAGTGGGGLDRIRSREFTLESTATGLPSGTVQSVCEDNFGNVWAVTQNGQLGCRTNGAWIAVSSETNWPGGKAACVASDHQGGIWVGTRNHVLYALRADHYTAWRTENGFKGHVVCGLLAETNGTLWVAEEEAIQCLQSNQWQTFNLPSKIGMPRALAKDDSQTIWIGTSKGFLLRINKDVLTDETTNVFGLPSSIRALAATADGSIWIGYASGGLGRYKDGRFAKITTAQGLFNDYISAIISDERGWLWFGSDRGIFKVHQRELNDLAEGRGTNVLSVHYGEGNGLPSLQASYGVSPNVLHSSDDRLWFPTLNALAVVNLDNLQESASPPPVLLKQVAVDGKVVASYGGALPVEHGLDLSDAHAKLQLPPNHRSLEFDIAALCFSTPENVHVQSRLAGYDDDWVDAKTPRSIGYSRLPAGDYRFQIRARNSDGPWGEPAGVAFVVNPFIWQTWWFRGATLGLLTFAIIAIVRYVSFRRLHSQLRALERQAALDKERSRIAKDIHDDLGGSLTQIKLLFELAQRNRTEPEKLDALGQEGVGATRQIMKSMDEIVWAINPRNDSLPHLIDYIGQFAIEFLAHADIRCRVDFPDRPVQWAVSPEVRHNLFLTVKEALNNVIRHSGANEVWLRVTATEKLLTIIVEDNGHGFEQKTPDAFADGLSNINRRMAEIGGQATIESTAGTGTRISLILPKPNE